jgi:predicted TIM-barrel fold metal-dependent hydrolase
LIKRRSFIQGLAVFAVAPAWARAPGLVNQIDAHAHVFTRQLKLAERRRYSVDYDATPDAYLSKLRTNGLNRGVVVQPSFLGFDNTYLLQALEAHRKALRGIAALPKEATEQEMRDLAKAGIVGVRLNLLGRSNPDLAAAAWQLHFARAKALGWQVEVQCEAGRLPVLLPSLIKSGVRVVIDHFGRPDATLGTADPGFQFLLNAASSGNVYVKLSGAYRVGNAIADAAAPLLLRAFGPERLVWGSDWPHTQFENVASAGEALRRLDHWIPDPEQRAVVLNDTAHRLFHFSETNQNVQVMT